MKCLLITKCIGCFNFLASVCILKIPRKGEGHLAAGEVNLACWSNVDGVILCLFSVCYDIGIVEEGIRIQRTATINDVLYGNFCLGISIVYNKRLVCISYSLEAVPCREGIVEWNGSNLFPV